MRGDDLGPRCRRCGVEARVHYRPPISCEGFVSKKPPFPVRLACAALTDGLSLANSLAIRLLKKGIQ